MSALDVSVPGVWRADAPPLVLASTSRTRLDLLAGAGLHPETLAPAVDERAVEARLAEADPIDLAQALAAAKAEAVAARRPDAIVIGADQVLACEGTTFHKPADRDAARVQLARLQGRTHALHSGVALVREGVTHRFCASALLTMRALSDEEIELYVAQAGERVRTSVGAYQLEGLGIHLFERIEGDHTTILGLPLLPLLARLRGWGLLAF